LGRIDVVRFRVNKLSLVALLALGIIDLCGSGEYARTVLTKGMAAFGKAIE